MTKDASLVTKPRNYYDIAKLGDAGALEEFLEQPLTAIAEVITGALGDGTQGAMVAGGRLVQALLKGRLLQQFAREFKRLRDTGRIPDDFAEKKYGFQTWVELMKIIDEELPDPERLEALKAMFFAVNKVNSTDGEQIAAYQLWHVAKSLTSGELFLLKLVYEERNKFDQQSTAYGLWESHMANAAGHSVRGLIGIHEKRLTEIGFLTQRQWDDLSGINPANARLTDFGLSFCANIENFQIEMRGGEIDGD